MIGNILNAFQNRPKPAVSGQGGLPQGASGYTPGLHSWEQTAQRRQETGNYLGGPGGWTPQAIGLAAGTLPNQGAQQSYMSPGLQASGRQFTGLMSAAPDRRNPLDRDISYELYGLGRNAPANNPRAVGPIFEATADIADYGRPGSRYNNLLQRSMTVTQRAADIARRAEAGLGQPAQAPQLPAPVQYEDDYNFDIPGAYGEAEDEEFSYNGLLNPASGLTGEVSPEVAEALGTDDEWGGVSPRVAGLLGADDQPRADGLPVNWLNSNWGTPFGRTSTSLEGPAGSRGKPPEEPRVSRRAGRGPVEVPKLPERVPWTPLDGLSEFDRNQKLLESGTLDPREEEELNEELYRITGDTRARRDLPHERVIAEWERDLHRLTDPNLSQREYDELNEALYNRPRENRRAVSKAYQRIRPWERGR